MTHTPHNTTPAAPAVASPQAPEKVNPFDGATLNKDQLAAAAAINPAAAPAKQPEPVVNSNQAAKAAGGKSYQFPSAPCTYEFRKGRRAHIPEGVYTTNDPDEIAELDEAVYVGNVYPFTGDILNVQQVPPPHVSPDRLN